MPCGAIVVVEAAETATSSFTAATASAAPAAPPQNASTRMRYTQLGSSPRTVAPHRAPTYTVAHPPARSSTPLSTDDGSTALGCSRFVARGFEEEEEEEEEEAAAARPPPPPCPPSPSAPPGSCSRKRHCSTKLPAPPAPARHATRTDVLVCCVSQPPPPPPPFHAGGVGEVQNAALSERPEAARLPTWRTAQR